MQRRLSIRALITLACAVTAVPALAATQIHNPSATPSTISFVASDPDNPLVMGNASASISFRTTGGGFPRIWWVQIAALGSGVFANCPNSVPVSNVLVTCVNASATGGSASCFPPINLSNSAQTIAWGFEGSGNTNYSVTLTFTFQDSWGFIAVPAAAPCTVNLNYDINAL